MSNSRLQPASFSHRYVAPVEVLLDELVALIRIRVAVVEAERQLDLIEAQIRFDQLFGVQASSVYQPWRPA